MEYWILLTKKEIKRIRYQAGRADGLAGFPPREDDQDYLRGYSEGFVPGSTTWWDDPYINECR